MFPRTIQRDLGHVIPRQQPVRADALKVLHPHLLAEQDLRRRFGREARIAQQLEHPNTVRLYDFGLDDQGGSSYIAYQPLSGQTVEELLCAEGALAPRRVTRIGTQVLKSLSEAHGVGVVHRDIKPDNIFLAQFEGEPDFVKVLDFGIAKLVIAGGLDEGTLTRSHGSCPNRWRPCQRSRSPVGSAPLRSSWWHLPPTRSRS